MGISHQVEASQLSASTMKRLQPYFEQGKDFHGYLSPGLALGIIMVDFAKEILGPRNLVSAVVETKACIPDAVQLMTSCSYGNGWMRVKDWGKVALTLYDKHELNGIRIFPNWEEIKKHSLIERWLMRGGNIDKEEVTKDIIKAGRSICSWQRVRVAPYKRVKNSPLALCSLCGESHPAIDGDLCVRCNGRENYYEGTDNVNEVVKLVKKTTS